MIVRIYKRIWKIVIVPIHTVRKENAVNAYIVIDNVTNFLHVIFHLKSNRPMIDLLKDSYLYTKINKKGEQAL